MLQNFAPGRGPFFSIIKRSAPDGGKSANFARLPSNSRTKQGANPGANPIKPGANPEFHEASLKSGGKFHLQMGAGVVGPNNVMEINISLCVCQKQIKC